MQRVRAVNDLCAERVDSAPERQPDIRKHHLALASAGDELSPDERGVEWHVGEEWE